MKNLRSGEHITIIGIHGGGPMLAFDIRSGVKSGDLIYWKAHEKYFLVHEIRPTNTRVLVSVEELDNLETLMAMRELADLAKQSSSRH